MRLQVDQPGQISPIRKARILKGRRLADVAAESGIHSSTLSRLERGLRPIAPDERREIARVLGIDAAELFFDGERSAA